MGIIWNTADKTHTIIINGTTTGELNAIDHILNNPQDGEVLENIVENILKPPANTGYRLKFKLFDKATMYYAMLLYPKGQDVADGWWLRERA